MSTPRFTAEFKQEAVRQIVERGHSVAEVSARIGVSAHSLYKWVKTVAPDRSEQRAAELTEAKSEIFRLRATAAYERGARHFKKGRAVLCQGTRVKYRFINDHRHAFRIATMCRVLRVTRGGFYQWLHKPLSDRAIEDQCLLGVIRDSYIASSGVYGSRRMLGDLREAGETCGKHSVAKIMRQNKIKAVRGYKAPRHMALRLVRSSPATGSAILRSSSAGLP